MRPTKALRHLSFVFLTLIALPGCGVVFFSSFEGTELLRELQLDGDLKPGSPLTVTVEVNDAYPIPIRIACYFENEDDLTDEDRRIVFHERATLIGELILDPVAQGEPGDEVEKQLVSFDFSTNESGNYFVACLTPAAPENGIGERFTIED